MNLHPAGRPCHRCDGTLNDAKGTISSMVPFASRRVTDVPLSL